MSNPYDKDGKMAEANKLLDEAKTFLYIGKVRQARKVWDQEPLRAEDREYHETFWKKIYEDCYKESCAAGMTLLTHESECPDHIAAS
jgi:hypothetical protein